MKTFTLEKLHRVSADRREGYVAAVLAAASEVTSSHVTLSDEAHAALRVAYTLPGRTLAARTPTPFHAIWAALHRHEPGADTTAFLDAVGRRLPCGDCSTHFTEFRAVVAPDTTSRTAFFAWTVQLHNEVNRRRGTPTWTIDAAAERWLVTDEARSAVG